ncbi:hypothetical protein [Tepidiforma sp.]|uniref:hypothetical protein n=1 Tax=Tepidiforma sp. TaxID=2682230 RepID=UPI002ADE8440|nr:hypothetical protein [Tepidiforma sp.]
MAEYPRKRLAPGELRALYNNGGFEERVRSGELSLHIEKDDHPSPLRAAEPLCTRSQLLAVVDRSGQVVARLHRYLRADGTIGGSGRPDPKAVLFDGVLYFV